MRDNYTLLMQKCNCGKPIRYSHSDGKQSCNKYDVCLTYEELCIRLEQLAKQNRIMRTTLDKIVEFDQQAYTYRAWADETLVNINK